MNLSFITPLLLTQLASTCLFIIAFIFGIKVVRKFNGILSAIIIPMLTYIAHIIGFYSFVIYVSIVGTRTVYTSILNGWGAGVRLHLAILLVVVFIILFYRGQKWIRPKSR